MGEMAEKKKTPKKPAPPASETKPAAAPRKPSPPPMSSRSLFPALGKSLPPGFARMPSDDRVPAGKGGKGEDGDDTKLTKQQVDAIRLLAITMAGPDLGDDAVMI